MQTTRSNKAARIKTDLKETLTVLGGFLPALLLSRVQIHSLHLPLALGILLGFALAGAEPYGVLGGVVLGSLICDHVSWHTICTAILFAVSLWVIKRRNKTCSKRFRIVLFAASGLSALPLAWISGAIEMLYGAVSVAIAVGFGLCVNRVLRGWTGRRAENGLTDREQIMFVLCIAAILLAVSELQLFGWSLSGSLLIAVSMFFVSVRGMYGAAAGTFCASALVLYTNSDPKLIGCIALGTSIASVLRKGGKPIGIASILLSSVAFGTFLSEHAIGATVPNILCGSLLYILTPREWIGSVRYMADSATRSERKRREDVTRIERHVSEELMRIGTLMTGFSGMFHTAMQEEDAVQSWTVQGALNVCRECKKQPVCWKDAQVMQETLLVIARAADEDLSYEPIDPIDPLCKKFRTLVSSVLLSYRQALNRSSVCVRAKEQAQLIDRQFVGVGTALRRYAEGMNKRDHAEGDALNRIRDALTQEGADVSFVDSYESNGMQVLSVQLNRPLRIAQRQLKRTLEQTSGTRLRIVQSVAERKTVSMLFENDSDLHASMRVFRAKEVGTISGDAAGECRIIGGQVCFALSDGMGSGKTARSESEAAIELLFRLHHAGIERELIYENVNRLLLSANDTEMYATLDSVLIDLKTGEAEFLKYGAPPSFLIRNGRVKPIEGEALPCGILAEAKPSITRIRLRANDRLVLCSDGVQDVLPEGTEQAIRSAATSGDQLGERILDLAKSRGGTDDKTVVVIRVA